MSDNPVWQFCGVLVREKPGMHPLAWRAYDAYGAVVECGMLGMSVRSSQAIAARIECGREFYRQLSEYVESSSPRSPLG